MTSATKVRAALLGFGYLGKWHAQKLASHSNIQFNSIIEPNTLVHDEIKKNYPLVKIYTSLDAALETFDAAIVATPTSLHYEHVSLLIKNQKHVFCEKPLAHSVEAAKELVSIASKNKSIVAQVGHSERCHEIFELKKADIANCNSGSVIFERYGAFKGRALDVSCVEDIMVHDLDLMLHLFRPSLLSCKAWGIKSKSKNWDTVKAQFVAKNHIFEFLVSRDAIEERRRMECFSEKGTCTIDFMTNSMTTTNNGLKTISYNKRDHLLFEQQNFFNSIIQGLPVMVSFNEGYQVCYLVSLILKCLELNKELPVSLP